MSKRARMKYHIDDIQDEILIRIISRLDLKQAISTSLVSRRWKTLWTLIPHLDLGTWNKYSPDAHDIEVPDMITRSLLHFGSLRVEKFKAFFHNHDQYVSQAHIHSWVLFSTHRGVRDLDICLFDDTHWVSEAVEFNRCMVPLSLLHCSSLEVLKLTFFDFPNSSLHLRMLKYLELHHVHLSADLNTSGCPLLERLLLHDCNDEQSNLNIIAPNPGLKYLKIHDIDFEPEPDDPNRATIFAPNLLRIEFTGCVRREYDILDLSLLESACFNLEEMDHFSLEPQTAISLVNLLQSVPHTATLKLCQRSIKILSFWEAKDVKLPQFEATCIKLETNLSKSQVMGMAFVLRNAPKIEKLIVDIIAGALSGGFWSWGFWNCVVDSVSDAPPWQSFRESLLKKMHLKVVEVNNFMITYVQLCEEPNPGVDIVEFLNWGSEVELLTELADSCNMLEKMVIRTIELPYWVLKSEFIPSLKERLEKRRKDHKSVVSFIV